jgi:hypothetical protein
MGKIDFTCFYGKNTDNRKSGKMNRMVLGSFHLDKK